MRTCVRGFSPSGTNFSVQACDSIRSLTRILISQGQSRTIGFQTLQKRPQYRDRLCSSVKLTMNVASPEREVKTIPPADYKPGSSLLQVVSEECDVVQLSKADILQIFDALQLSVKKVSALLARAGINDLFGYLAEGQSQSAERDKAKKLDVIANEVLKQKLGETGLVRVCASEEDDVATEFPERMPGSKQGGYVAVFDPLDGSSNIDASIPTGTIFGLYRTNGLQGDEAALQLGADQIAAAYALYSSASMLVLTLGHGTHGFTLDPSTGEFVLTHPNIRIPKRGQIYSLNDGRYWDWPEGLRSYIDNIRQGRGQNPKQYSARYICSLVADLHRTLLYGGVAMNPRSHLRLVYEANPLAFITEQAGGRASNGVDRILNIPPSKLHQRLPLFLGSPDDMAELESYGDVQQTHNPGYSI